NGFIDRGFSPAVFIICRSTAQLLRSAGSADGSKRERPAGQAAAQAAVRVKEKLVRPERFELPACCSGGNRSIQLSYGRTTCQSSLHGGRKGLQCQAMRRRRPTAQAAL